MATTTVEPRPHYGFICDACGPSEGMWSSEADAAWAGEYHVYVGHGGPPVKPVPPSHWTQRKGD